MNLSVDIETFSSVDLKKCGVYAYADSPDFEILLFAYAYDDEETKIVDLACGQKLPPSVLQALTNETIIKTAFNASFERICLSKYLNTTLSPVSWQCTAVQSAMIGLPQTLDGVGKVLNIQKKKLKEGADLIRFFSLPCKPTKANEGRVRNLPNHAPEKWELFKTYCIRDVDAEREIKWKLRNFQIPDSELELYKLDQIINDRGIMVDCELVSHAINCHKKYKDLATAQAYEMTGLSNPNSITQIKEWLSDHGVKAERLDKKTINQLLAETDGEILEVLKLRLSMAKTSIMKYESVERCVCKDGRVHGLLQFFGAARTGRWAGRLVQVQNLPQNHMPDLELARQLVKLGQYEMLEVLYETLPEVLSELIRTAFIPKAGNKFIIADFSAVEARVIAWLAGETWRNEVFATHGRIYEASASQMFHVPLEEITKSSPLRQKGKISELALGYGGSAGALKAMGALEMGLTEDELQPLVSSWRASNPNIVRLWWEVDRAAKTAVKERTITETHGIQFSYQNGLLHIRIPSGRKLAYVKPRIGINQFGSECVTYEGLGVSRKWGLLESYGPKFVENIVQAISRDILCYAMINLYKYAIVMHVHDEIVIEAEPEVSVKTICEIMEQTPPWANGLLLRADGFECNFYQKE